MNKENACENKKRKIHAYQTGEKVLLRKVWKTKFNQYTYFGLYVITAVRDNCTVRARKGRITYTSIIRNLTPYKE